MVKHNKQVVAIFGGSFDPPHQGHQSIVNSAIENLNIDKLLVIPAYLNPFKVSSIASATQRLKWCQALFDDNSDVIVDDYEIKENQSTTTSQSVKHFNIEYDVKYLIIGSDNLSTLPQWHNFKWLNENIIWVIVTRDKCPLEIKGLREWRTLLLDEPMSSTQIRASKELQYIDKKIKKSVQKILQGKN